jgi:hypothetical protein
VLAATTTLKRPPTIRPACTRRRGPKAARRVWIVLQHPGSPVVARPLERYTGRGQGRGLLGETGPFGLLTHKAQMENTPACVEADISTGGWLTSPPS